MNSLAPYLVVAHQGEQVQAKGADYISPAARDEFIFHHAGFSWIFWQMGSAPLLGGGFGHFYAYAPSKIEYQIDRYAIEVKRQLDVLDQRLAQNDYLAGDEYTIADMAVWPWYGTLAMGQLYEAGEFLQMQNFKRLNPAARVGQCQLSKKITHSNTTSAAQTENPST